jgi:hypothetical protein
VNSLKAIELVGEKDVGLCSCSKMYLPRNLMGFIRRIIILFISKFIHPIWKKPTSTELSQGNFSGFYALFRPYWKDSEDDGIKKLHNPKQEIRLDLDYTHKRKMCMGEDSYLKNCMRKKHRVLYLREIGCISIGKQLMYNSSVQFERGRNYYHRGWSLIEIILKSIIYLQPHQLRGYLFERRINNNKDESYA